MNIIECPNGHYYDSDKYSSCPHCDSASVEAPVYTQPAVDLEVKKTEPVDASSSGKVIIPDGFDGVDDTVKIKEDEVSGQNTTGDKTIRYFDAINAEPVAGWLVCIEGKKNFGKDFKLKVGGNFIGRASEMDVCLAGDSSVSRLKHAVVLYEPKNNIFILQPGESRQLTYLNDSVVLSPTEIKVNDVIQVGDTKLMFIPCCTDKFKWDDVIPEEEGK